MLGRNLILKMANINLLQNESPIVASRPIILERKFQRGSKKVKRLFSTSSLSPALAEGKNSEPCDRQGCVHYTPGLFGLFATVDLARRHHPTASDVVMPSL